MDLSELYRCWIVDPDGDPTALRSPWTGHVWPDGGVSGTATCPAQRWHPAIPPLAPGCTCGFTACTDPDRLAAYWTRRYRAVNLRRVLRRTVPALAPPEKIDPVPGATLAAALATGVAIDADGPLAGIMVVARCDGGEPILTDLQNWMWVRAARLGCGCGRRG